MASERGRDTKYRIAETAMALFLDQGYEKVTVEAVADASQVSRRTVFRYFASKDELPFPDHSERLALVERRLYEREGSADPVEVVIAATEASLRDFLRRPEVVLRRYQLTRVVRELRDREIIEHERYVTLTTAFLREHLPTDAPSFQAPGLAALIDAIHRSALGNWARSGGKTDALAELAAGMEWIRTLLIGREESRSDQLLVAVLPDSARTRRSLLQLRDAATELL